ncbi:MAG: hypothetical protein EOP06_15070 [Proteobacteria bacterium]|nr:MAG: hypothetical protein EOP06_15070 [Pseudomonadota bacterium]
MKSWLKGIKGRLLVAACIPVIATIFLIAVSISSSNKLGNHLDTAYKNLVPSLNALSDIRGERGNVLSNVWAAHSMADRNKEDTAQLIKDARTSMDRFKAAITEYDGVPNLPGEVELYQPVKNALPAFESLTEEILKKIEMAAMENRDTRTS